MEVRRDWGDGKEGRGVLLNSSWEGERKLSFCYGEYELPVAPLNPSPLYGMNPSLGLGSHSNLSLESLLRVTDLFPVVR